MKLTNPISSLSGHQLNNRRQKQANTGCKERGGGRETGMGEKGREVLHCLKPRRKPHCSHHTLPRIPTDHLQTQAGMGFRGHRDSLRVNLSLCLAEGQPSSWLPSLTMHCSKPWVPSTGQESQVPAFTESILSRAREGSQPSASSS